MWVVSCQKPNCTSHKPNRSWNHVHRSNYFYMVGCLIPNTINFHWISQNISSCLHRLNLGGPVEINYYGDTTKKISSLRRALLTTRINIHDIVDDAKMVDKISMTNWLIWALNHSTPTSYLVISNNEDLMIALTWLEEMNYWIMTSQPDPHSRFLIEVSIEVWY